MANKKEFILDIAEKMFVEQGFDQTSDSRCNPDCKRNPLLLLYLKRRDYGCHH